MKFNESLNLYPLQNPHPMVRPSQAASQKSSPNSHPDASSLVACRGKSGRRQSLLDQLKSSNIQLLERLYSLLVPPRTLGVWVVAPKKLSACRAVSTNIKVGVSAASGHPSILVYNIPNQTPNSTTQLLAVTKLKVISVAEMFFWIRNVSVYPQPRNLQFQTAARPRHSIYLQLAFCKAWTDLGQIRGHPSSTGHLESGNRMKQGYYTQGKTLSSQVSVSVTFCCAILGELEVQTGGG